MKESNNVQYLSRIEVLIVYFVAGVFMILFIWWGVEGLMSLTEKDVINLGKLLLHILIS